MTDKAHTKKPITVELVLKGKGAVAAVKKARNEMNLYLREMGVTELKVGFGRLPKNQGTGARLTLKLSLFIQQRLAGVGILADLLAMLDAPMTYFGKKFEQCYVTGFPIMGRPT